MSRVAFAYDHLFPETVGGAQRYYWTLARALAQDGPVSYLTPRRWPGERRQERDGVEVLAVSRGPGGLAYRLGLAWHLLRHGGRYSVVHCGGFPVGTPLAARLGLLPHRRTALVVDWFEVLPRATWRRLKGRLAGDVAYLLQRLSAPVGEATVFARMHERRLREQGRAGAITVVPAFLPDPPAPAPAAPRERVLLFAGRLEADKCAHLVPAVLAELRRRDPDWRALVFGRGPEEPRLRAAIAAAGVADAVALKGFAPWEEVSAAMRSAAVLLAPSVREGFGIVVLEAAAHGLPAVLVDEPDNAATELIEDGQNGVVSRSADPVELAAAVLAAAGAPAQRWFEAAAERYSVPAAVREHRLLHERLTG